MKLEVPELPKLARRPDGNWDVILDDINPKQIEKLAGETLFDGEWFFVSESRARAAAFQHWINCVKNVVSAEFKPKVEKPVEEKEPWWVADRAAGFKFHD